jgi:predicted ArsR family transcriptional regulator
MPDFDERFLESTRGRVVSHLRDAARTVHDLSVALGLSPNAVRSHLVALERDGVVRSAGVRRGGAAGKPATVYELTAEAETRLSRAYPPFLEALLDVLADRMGRRDLDTLLRDVGKRLAPKVGEVGRDVAARATAAAGLLNALGGAAEVVVGEGGVEIQSHGCPLAAVVSRRPEVCGAIRALIAEVTRGEVRERCERGERSRCRFVVEDL